MVEGWEFVKASWRFLNYAFDDAESVMDRFGLHQKTLVLLALLDLCDTPQELARLIRTPPSTLSHMLREVEERGLVTRSLDTQDKRKFRLRRTPEGDDALQSGIAAINDGVQHRFAALSPEERTLLAHALPLLLRLTDAPQP